MLNDRRFIYPAVCLGCLSLLLFAFSQPGFVSQFVDSDKLLIVDWTNYVFVEGYPWAEFQLPRTPSLFPDFLISVPVQLATGSWRAAIFVGALISLITLVYAVGTIVGRMAGTSTASAVGITWLALFPIFLIEMAASNGAGRHFGPLMPAAHGGSFIVALIAVIVAERAISSGIDVGNGIILFALCALTVLSDRLFVFYFCVPLTAMLIYPGSQRATALRIFGVVLIGSATGWFSALLFNLQPGAALNIASVFNKAELFLRDMPMSVMLGSVMPAAIIMAAFAFYIATGKATRPTATFWVFAITSILTTVALTAAFLYEDRGAYRYLAPLVWWPTIFGIMIAAGTLKRLSTSISAWTLLPSAIAAALLFTAGAAPTGSLWRWQNPVASCLATTPLRDGLAGFWEARSIKVSSNWTRQVDQITPDGRIFHWGNNLASYAQSQFDLSRAPNYNFIALADLDQTAISKRFGAPHRIMKCGDAAVWIYNHSLSVAER